MLEGGRENSQASEGIGWVALRYHKTPTVPATAFDILQGVVVALLVAGRRKVVFDMRGFWADERVDGNLWTRTRPPAPDGRPRSSA